MDTNKAAVFHVLADSAYGGQNVLCELPKNCDLTSRMLMNERLYGAPPQRKPGTHGRPRNAAHCCPRPKPRWAGERGV